MNIKPLASALAAASIIATSSDARAADLVWDWSPVTTGATATTAGYSNRLDFQHFAERVSFVDSLKIVGMDIYADDRWAHIGTSVLISIYADDQGRPGNVIQHSFTHVSQVDRAGAPEQPVQTMFGPATLQRVHADFSGFTMQAGVGYWIGMTGWGSANELTQAGLANVPGGDDSMALFGAFDHFIQVTSGGDMAFRLYAASIPEPSTALMAFLGVFGLLARRKLVA